MPRSKIKKTMFGLSLISLLCILPSIPAGAANFESRWSGTVTDSADSYFVPVEMAAGDFDGDRRDEALVVDVDGVCHLLDWNGERLVEEWITSFSVSEGKAQKVVAASLDGAAASGVILAADGSLVVIRRDKVGFRKVCGDCLNPTARDRYQILRIAAAPMTADLRDGIIAVARSKNELFILPLRWSRGQFNVVDAFPFDPGMSPQGIFPARTDRGPAETYYAYGVGSGRQAMLSRIVKDEEGLGVDKVWPLSGVDFSQKFLRPVDVHDGRIDLLTLGVAAPKPPAAKNNPKPVKPKKPAPAPAPKPAPKPTVEARIFTPGKSDPDESFPVGLPSPVFAASGDFNGDGTPDLIFGNYAGVFEIYSKPVRELELDGKRAPLAGRAALHGKTIFIDPELLGRVTTEHGDYLTVRNNYAEIVFELKTGKTYARAKGQEEADTVTIPTRMTAGKLFIAIDPAARRMGFDWQWDRLSARLRIADTHKENRYSWPRTR